MAPRLRGKILFNTENEKKSVYLSENEQPEGEINYAHLFF